MGPLYQHGDYVLISRSAWRRLRRGDDVVARHGVLGVVLKRITARIGNQLELKGLNALSMTSTAAGREPGILDTLASGISQPSPSPPASGCPGSGRRVWEAPGTSKKRAHAAARWARSRS